MMLGAGTVFAGGVRNFSDSWPINSQTAWLLLQEQDRLHSKQLQVVVSAGQGRLFDMPELTQTYLNVRGTMKPGPFFIEGGGLWEKTGSGLFVEDRLQADLLWGHSPSLGLSVELLRHNLGGQSQTTPPHLNVLWAISFAYNSLRGRLHLQWPLSQVPNFPGTRGRQNFLNLIIQTSDLAAALVVDRQLNGTPQAGFHFLLALHPGVGLELRIDGPTGSLGPGLTLARGALMVRTSHVVHPHLGITHRIMLVFGKFGGGV